MTTEPTTDRAAARDLAADAIRAAACPGNDCPLSEADCSEQRIQPAAWERGVLSEVYGRPEWFADAVLAVLPEPADQAAALNRAADEVFALDYDALVGEEGDENLGSMREAWDLGTIHATNLLRRLADEPAVPGPVAGEQQNETPEAETPTTTTPAASPSVVDEVVAALQAKAQALSVEAEEEMRRDLEDQAQVWHEAADLARRTGRKAVRNAQPTAKPETDGEGAATRFNWSDIIPAPVDETAQERDRLIDRINRVRVALRDCKERGATGMQYEIAVREAIGDREPRRGPGPLCHESDPRTLRECALKANHGGDHEDGDLSWPRSAEHQPAAGVRQDGAQP